MDNVEEHPATILVSQAEAARLLSVDRTTIWRMRKRGDLAVVSIGRRALITRASINSYVSAQIEK
jgi:excisionase family DNA binding protein